MGPVIDAISDGVLQGGVGRPGGGLKVLVLDEWLPYPPDSGKRVRTWNVLRRLARNHDIALLCYGQEGSAAEALRAAGIRVHLVEPPRKAAGLRLYGSLLLNLISRQPYSVTKHYSARFERALRTLVSGDSFDLVHCEWTPYARFLRAATGTPTFVMAHNIESTIWSRRAAQAATPIERTFLRLQASKMRRFEREALRRADGVAAVTEVDARQMRDWGVKHVTVSQNGVDLEKFAPTGQAPRGRRVLFCGSLDWFPNLDALDFFVKAVLPALRRLVPEATLQVVGNNPPPELKRRLAREAGVEFVGAVPDVRRYLAEADIVAVPLRIGGGSRIKILEALAMGKAVVSTSIGSEGLAVIDGTHLALANTPAEFASRTAQILTCHEERRRMGEAGRRLVAACYGWDHAVEALGSAWTHTVSSRVRHAGREGWPAEAKAAS